MKNTKTAYQYHHLTEEAKKVAQEQNKGTLLTQWFYNADGTKFQNSTVVQLLKTEFHV